MTEIPDQSSAIEGALRDVAPALPPALKSRTLAHCASRVAAKRHREARRNRYLVCGLAVVFAMQWFSLSFIDGQTDRLMAGNSTASAFSEVSIVQAIELLQERSRLMVQWMGQSNPKFKAG